MRFLLAIGTCVAYLAFGLIGGAAHVHEAADHHQEMQGLHLDHSHVGVSHGHSAADHEGHPSHPDRHDGGTAAEKRHVDHHEGDALYLSISAKRSVDMNLSGAPVVVRSSLAMHRPSGPQPRELPPAGLTRGPPDRAKTVSRAPPV